MLLVNYQSPAFYLWPKALAILTLLSAFRREGKNNLIKSFTSGCSQEDKITLLREYCTFFFPFTSRNCCCHMKFKSSNSASLLSERKICGVAPLFKQQQEEEPPKSCCRQRRTLPWEHHQAQSAWMKDPSCREQICHLLG